MAEKLLTLKDAADVIGVQQNTLGIWVEKGLVPVVLLPCGSRRFSLDDVERFKAGLLTPMTFKWRKRELS